MRKSIFEVLNDKGNVNLQKEIDNIELIIRDLYIYGVDYLYDFIDEKIVKEWKYSKRCLNLNDLFENLEIGRKDLHKYNYDIEHSLRYIELMYNLVMKATEYICNLGFEYEAPEDFMRLDKNIKSLLEELNYKLEKVEDRYEIIEKDEKATYVAESNPKIALEIIEYRKYDLKGNVKAKKEILQKLAQQVEALKGEFDKTQYDSLMKDTQYLLNNFNIRHNNLEGKYKIDTICNMKNDELEMWYDIIYNNILSVFIIRDYMKNKLKIDAIKKIVK